ncbi:magnesium/cobalt transporter CorA [bacterium]|nr:magnesium/cobalt transporter CorA [bacterium]
MTLLKSKSRRSKKKGLPPGSLVYVGEEPKAPVIVERFYYGKGTCVQQVLENPLSFKLASQANHVEWLNVEGIHDTALVAYLGKELNIHPLVLEDVMNSNQRPKIEDFGSYIYLVLKMLRFDEVKREVFSEQVSFIVGPNWLVSFQEGFQGDVFNSLRDRIKTGAGTLIERGTDFLLYSLLDVIVDHYFECLEKLGDVIEETDEAVTHELSSQFLSTIHHLKKNLITLRRSLWPLREVMLFLDRTESQLVAPGTKKYFRDVYDHAVQIMETVETDRDMVQGLMDIYLTTISNQQNSVMKTLTLMATIFMPLTFIVGVYGMNFDFMPELRWEFGYPAVWIFMTVLTLGMVVFFKKKKWF